MTLTCERERSFRTCCAAKLKFLDMISLLLFMPIVIRLARFWPNKAVSYFRYIPCCVALNKYNCVRSDINEDETEISFGYKSRKKVYLASSNLKENISSKSLSPLMFDFQTVLIIVLC